MPHISKAQIEQVIACLHCDAEETKLDEVAKVMQSLLNQPEGEPVATIEALPMPPGILAQSYINWIEKCPPVGTELFTHPPAPRQPITSAKAMRKQQYTNEELALAEKLANEPVVNLYEKLLKQAARIAELEAQLSDAKQVARYEADVASQAIADFEEVKAQLAAPRQITAAKDVLTSINGAAT